MTKFKECCENCPFVSTDADGNWYCNRYNASCDSIRCNGLIDNRYLPVLGFNTKQWWIYDDCDDCYIDIPIEVLVEVEKYESYSEKCDYLSALCNAWKGGKPDWLFDEQHRYYDETFEI